MSKPTQSLDLLFIEIGQRINDSRAQVASGNKMELGGLDDSVRALCETVLKMPEPEHQKYIEPMNLLLENLKMLSEEMVAQKESLSGELRQLGDHKKANVAYRTVEASGSKDEK